MKDLTQSELKAMLRYDADSGMFYWLESKRGRKGIAKKAGCVRKSDGRRRIRINGKLFYAYRLAWLYMTGRWPTNVIDHIDGDPSNDAWHNLRDVGIGTNLRNKVTRGYSWCDRIQKYRAYYHKPGRKYFHIGVFDCQLDARAAHLRSVREEGLSPPRLGKVAA